MSEENLSVVTSEKEPKQDKEALRARWAWVEHRVWTDSMLRSLERGIKGGKWYALIDKVYELKNLQSGFWKVWRNAGSAGAGLKMVRYADDFVVLSRTEKEAYRALELIRTWMEQAQLRLHPDKTKVVDTTQRGGFDFLGYHFERGQKWPRKKSEKRLKEKLRQYTRRNNGQSLGCIIRRINPILRGWYHYFRYSKLNALQSMDGWI